MPPSGKKFYFIQTSDIGFDSRPIEINLIPVSGNPDLEVTLISDLSNSQSEWRQESTKPHFISSNKMGMDSMILDPKTNEFFFEKCKESCVILIGVVNNRVIDDKDDSRMKNIHFKLQVSQNFKELVET